MSTRQPIIGITTYARDESNQLHLPADYVDAVRRAGGCAVLLPPGPVEPQMLLSQIDGLLLTGGGDIDPARYRGQHHATVYMVDAERDEMELALARAAIDSGKPTLAICRGSQIVNVALGGTLHVHLPDVVGEQIEHRKPPREPTPHPVQIESSSRLAGLIGTTSCAPMSWHHQAVCEVAATLRAVAWAADGTIEAVECPDRPSLVAVQWHPELTAAEDPSQQGLFDALVRAASAD